MYIHYKEFLSYMIETLSKNVTPFRFPLVVINQDQIQVSLMKYAMKMPSLLHNWTKCQSAGNECYLLALPNNIQLSKPSLTVKYDNGLLITALESFAHI